MNGAIGLSLLVLVPLVVALVATRVMGNRAYFVVGAAVAAELLTIPLTRWWSQHAAARALARAQAEHRDLLVYARAQQTLGHQIIVCVVLSIVAAAIAVAVFTLARPARA